ncbi:right-handed parallel beta-helix repeat-containing protein [Bacillus spongiae]|uniref:Right-handed parallel beta-helix repeat-containing protein n=1 Tax=Bacillus spongiae TaxID=2683610 RepID=A0ABU8H8Y6_9BACI
MVLRVVPSVMYSTVQAAIDDSSSGDSLKILAGTFDGFEVTVGKDNLKIFGCGIGRTIIAGASAQGSNDGVVVNANRTILQGFTVQGFSNIGIFVPSNNNVMKQIESTLNSDEGILIIGENNLISNCKTSFNNSGIEINDENNCVISCVSTQNDFFGYSFQDVQCKLLFSLAKNNRSIGLDLDDDFNTIFQNKFLGNGCGIKIDDENNNVIGNIVCNNIDSGILLDNNADFNVVDSNIVKNNGNDVSGGSGIFVDSSTENNPVRFNKLRNNTPFDIEIEGLVTDNIYNGNKCENSNFPGICT